MKTKRNNCTILLMILILSVFYFVPITSQAQIWKDLGKKVEKKVEQQASKRIERRIDKAIDKGFDSAEDAADDAVKGNKKNEEKATKNNSKSSQSSIEAVLSGLNSNVPVKDNYDFNVGVTYDMVSKKGKKEEKLPGTTIWLSKNDYVGITSTAQNDAFMVLDENGMITFMEKEKQYMSMGAGALDHLGGAVADAAEADGGKYSFKKIGSENILGLACEIYEFKSEDGIAKVWITNALDVSDGFTKAFTRMMKNTKSKIPYMGEKTGMMMKMESTDNNGEIVIMEAKSINKNGKKINTKDYKSIGF